MLGDLIVKGHSVRALSWRAHPQRYWAASEGDSIDPPFPVMHGNMGPEHEPNPSIRSATGAMGA